MPGVAHAPESADIQSVAGDEDRFASDMGARIRRARTDAKLTQQDLASAVGVRTATIGDYEKGRINASTKVIRAIADQTGVPAGWIMGDEPRVVMDSDDDGDHPALVEFLASRLGQTATPAEIASLRTLRPATGTPTVDTYSQMLTIVRTTVDPDEDVQRRFKDGEHMRGSLDRFRGK